ncbi:acyltransferase family protein [Nostoc sp.]|uniref:acyltransferase family protein n=1 Tax=Nostoc sp. TaxID=1180 RepID=UPI002FFB9434
MINRIEKTLDKQRDIRFDILKTIALIFIIFAHVGPENNIFFDIRRFDVPLMVIASGTLYYYSANNKNISFWNYLQKRLPRLIAPVWLFLTFFFISANLIFLLLAKPYPFSSSEIIETFFFLKGIGYVWIIRVFTLVAIFANPLLKLYKFCKSENKFLALLFLIYLGYEILFIKIGRFNLHNQIIIQLIDDYLFYLIPYGCLFGLGIVLLQLRFKKILFISGFFLTIFLLLTGFYYRTLGHFASTADFKYPPTMYFVSYGIFMSLFAFCAVDRICSKYNLSNNNHVLIRGIIFISSSSLWIYLWHIFFVYYWQTIVVYLPKFASHFLIAFSVVTVGAIAVTYLQKKIVSGIIKKTTFGQNYSNLLSMLLLK